MSWPGWNAGGAPAAPHMLVNPAPAVAPPAAMAPPSIPPQYSAEQWAQMQHQNWAQWAQWQQQYQQWHQQYGAEYQKSLSAMAGGVMPAMAAAAPLPGTIMPNMAAPPPPAPENKPPPPPPPEEPAAPAPTPSYSTMPPKAAGNAGYSTMPPKGPPQQNQFGQPQYQAAQYGANRGQNWGSKRPFNQENREFDINAKRQMMESSWNKGAPPPPAGPAPGKAPLNIEELSDAEKKFDKEFAAWEAQFNKWKEQNANHPDKTQYREYEKKWESWRNSLLERREQMRKKRLGMVAAAAPPAPAAPAAPTPAKPPVNTFNQPPPAAGRPPAVEANLNKPLPVASENLFAKPPPTQNDEPLTFKKKTFPGESVPESEEVEGDGFLKSGGGEQGGIPGLDLVKDAPPIEDKPDEVEIPEEEIKDPAAGQQKGADLDAISKGINTILGDQKLLSMLTTMTQNQPPTVAAAALKVSDSEQNYNRPPPGFGQGMNLPPPNFNEAPPKFGEQNRSFDDNLHQREAVNNFDDQTRMSFSSSHNEVEAGFGGNSFRNNRFGNVRNDNFGRFGGPEEGNRSNFNNRGRNNFGPNEGNDFNSRGGFNRNEPGFNRNEPGFNRNEPGFNRNEPGFNRNEPLLNRNDPGFNRNEPLLDRNEPGFNRNEPLLNRNEPGFNRNEPLLNRNESGFNRNEPLLNRNEPLLNRNEPLLNRNEPLLNRNESLLNRNKPGFNRNEPGFNRNEPLLNRNEPGFNKNEPLLNRNEPGFNRNEPGFNRNEPGFNRNQPGLNKIEPLLGKDLGFIRNEPGLNRIEPLLKRGESLLNRNEPGFNRKEPLLNRPEPGFNRNEPGFGRNEPGFNRNEPGFGRNEPSFNRNEPGFNRNEPSFNRNEPGFNRNEPGFNRNEPGFNRNEPGFNRNEPGFNRNEPNFNRNEPGFNRNDTFNRNDNFNNRNANKRDSFDNNRDFDNRGGHNEEYNDYDENYDENQEGYEENYEQENYHQENFKDDQWNEDEDFDKYHEMFNDDEGPPPPKQAPPPPINIISQINIVPPVNIVVPEVPEVPAIEEPIFTPEKVTDYEHKSIIPVYPEVELEVLQVFDYRHKPLNRIPYPQRPVWLSKAAEHIRQFDPLASRHTFERPAPFERPSVFERPPAAGRFPSPERRGEFGDRSERGGRYDRIDRFERRGDDGNRRGRYEEDRDRRGNDFGRRGGNNPRDEQRGRRPSESRGYQEKGLELEELSDGDMDFEQKNQNRDGKRDDWEQDDINNDRNDHVDNRHDRRVVDGRRYDNFDSSFSRNRRPSPDLASGSNPTNPAAPSQPTPIEDLICAPGRHGRPPRIVVILRGPPGSGKTHLARVIKDKEVENGGSAPRILSLDDYFMVEQEKVVLEDGKPVKVKEMVYEYEAGMEESYRQSFVKAFKKTVTDGYFPFIIVDNINDKVKYFGEMWSFAKQNGFQVYICQMDLDPQLCTKRNVHNRSEEDIEECIAGWEPTPSHHPMVDATGFLQASITEVEMEELEPPGGQADDQEEEQDDGRSKWDTFDCSVNNLARLDGVSKPLRPSHTMEEYLQMDDDWSEPAAPLQPGKKRVRWADLEERKQQAKMRAIGFVVGQTNWDRMMDPTNGESALTKTKYIERVRKNY